MLYIIGIVWMGFFLVLLPFWWVSLSVRRRFRGFWGRLGGLIRGRGVIWPKMEWKFIKRGRKLNKVRRDKRRCKPKERYRSMKLSFTKPKAYISTPSPSMQLNISLWNFQKKPRFYSYWIPTLGRYKISSISVKIMRSS